MRIPTVFINIENAGGMNPLAAVIKQHLLGATTVNQLRHGDEGGEADLAVTNSVSEAERMVRVTAATVVVVAHFTDAERTAADRFAARFPERTRSASYREDGNGRMPLVSLLDSLIAERSGGGQ